MSVKFTKFETLFKNRWLEMREIKDADTHEGYTYIHENRCNGHIVSLLPFRRTDDGYEYLLRREITPCWGKDPLVSSITGGVEECGIITSAAHELEEEGGYHMDTWELIDLGTIFGTKCSDTIYHLWSADLTDKEKGIAGGDGSKLESIAECFWAKDIKEAVDPLVSASFIRLGYFLTSFND